ncbi:MAG: TetR/AcrR family transcriptional regulator [Candidatus Dormibacteria bacterium]
MAGRYQLKLRAERQEETRQRIVAAAVALHTSVGPLHTTDSAIAERAGITRVTFYRHFPTDVALFQACTSHGLACWPLPDSAAWAHIADPAARLGTALRELYAYYAIAGDGLVVLLRDLPLMRAELRVSPNRTEVLRAMVPGLARGWGARGRRVSVGRASIEHALSVFTWQSLVRHGGLDDDEAVDALVALVERAYGRPCSG